MNQIPSWTSEEERAQLRLLASEVPDGGHIVEIGCLYGGTTYELAVGNPKVKVTTIDDFSWTPENMPKATPELADKNLKDRGITNVFILVGKSAQVAKEWKEPIDLCFIDGGHSFEFVNTDIRAFAKHSQVIALHDYHNPAEWMGVTRAVDEFLLENSSWHLDNVVGMIVTLRRLK